MTTAWTGEQWCPYGSEQASPAAAFCVGAIDVATAVPLAELFAGGAVAAWATDLIAGLNLGTVLVSDLCSTPPIDPGPFDPGWFLGPSFGDNARGIIAWIIRSTYLRLFQSCCRCNPPPAPSATLVGTITFDAISGANRYFYITNPYPTTPCTLQLVIHNSSPFPAGGGGTWVDVLPVQCTNTANPTCSNLVAASGSGLGTGYGPAGCANIPASCGAYGSTITSQLYTIAGAAQCVGMEVSFQGGASGHFSGFVDIYVAPNTAIPLTSSQLVPPGFGLAPSGAPSTTGVIPYPANGQVFCNLAQLSAQKLQELVVPQGAEPLAVHAISGTGGVSVPPTASGAVLELGTLPPNVSHDAGSPPLLYHAGWMAWADPDGNILGPQMRITASNQQIWGATDQVTQLRYNLYPGVSGTLTFLAAPTPT